MDQGSKLLELEKKAELLRFSYNKVGLIEVLGKMAEICAATDRSADALSFLHEQELVLRSQRWGGGLGACLINQSLEHFRSGSTKEANAALDKAEKDCPGREMMELYSFLGGNLHGSGLGEATAAVYARLGSFAAMHSNLEVQATANHDLASVLCATLEKGQEALRVAQSNLTVAQATGRDDLVRAVHRQIEEIEILEGIRGQ